MTEMEIPMSKPANKRTAKAAKKRSPKGATEKAAVVPPSRPAKTTSTSGAKEDEKKGSKQSRVVEMLRASTGTTILAVMEATGWQQHSVRGFFAGVVQRKLRLKVISEKIDGKRVYRIFGGASPKTARLSRRTA